jgi:protein CMS1
MLMSFSRAVRKFQTKDAVVAKLFAKHIKIKDAVKFLQSNRTGMAVGTPIRLNDLVEEGMSCLSNQSEIPG